MRKKIFIYLSILFIFGLVIAGFIVYNFTNTPYPPDIALSDYEPESMLVTPSHPVYTARFPVIDFHSHPEHSSLNIDQIVDVLDRSGVRKVVDLNGSWGWAGERLKRKIEAYKLKYPDRFIVFYNLNLDGIGDDDFVLKRLNRLIEAKKMGVRGIKIWKRIGMTLYDTAGHLVPVDDLRLDPIWEKAGELNLPVLIHVGDPLAFWQPVDRFNERYEELTSGDEYILQGADFPSLETILQQRENLIRKHPNTIFIGAHMGGLGWNLRELSRLLDTYSNFHVEISDRLYEVGRQPFTARDFFIKYQDRILFGIDLYPEVSVYLNYYRFFETFDEYFEYPRSYFKHGKWKIYGISLPDAVLEKLYHLNADRLLSM